MMWVVGCLWPIQGAGIQTQLCFIFFTMLQGVTGMEGAEPTVPDQRSWLWHIQDEKLLFTQLMCTSCFFQPLAVAKNTWNPSASQNNNVITHFCSYRPYQSLICFLGSIRNEVHLLNKSTQDIHSEWKMWKHTMPWWSFQLGKVGFLPLPVLLHQQWCTGSQMPPPASTSSSVTGKYRLLLPSWAGSAPCWVQLCAKPALLWYKRGGILRTPATNRKNTIRRGRGQLLQGSTPQGKRTGTACICSCSSTTQLEEHKNVVTKFKGDCFLKCWAQQLTCFLSNVNSFRLKKKKKKSSKVFWCLFLSNPSPFSYLTKLRLNLKSSICLSFWKHLAFLTSSSFSILENGMQRD